MLSRGLLKVRHFTELAYIFWEIFRMFRVYLVSDDWYSETFNGIDHILASVISRLGIWSENQVLNQELGCGSTSIGTLD